MDTYGEHEPKGAHMATDERQGMTRRNFLGMATAGLDAAPAGW